MKFLYVCVSDDFDDYLEQTFASIITLKKYNRDAHVSLLIDSYTESKLVNGRENIKKIVDEIVVAELDPTLSGKVRSRILKTSMRNLVSGDFLFIDGDTIVLDELFSIEKIDAEIAGVLDMHLPLSLSSEGRTHRNRMSKLCSEKQFLFEEKFFNSGVLFVRDTPNMGNFFSLWNAEWNKSNEKGVSSDQPSLALALYKYNQKITELDGKWNCQLYFGANFFRTAKIVHYFASNGSFLYSKKMTSYVKEHRFDENCQKIIRDNADKILSSFDNCFLCTGSHFSLMSTLCYRFLFILFSKKKLFFLLERVLSFGQGRGFFHRVNK